MELDAPTRNPMASGLGRVRSHFTTTRSLTTVPSLVSIPQLFIQLKRAPIIIPLEDHRLRRHTDRQTPMSVPIGDGQPSAMTPSTHHLNDTPEPQGDLHASATLPSRTFKLKDEDAEAAARIILPSDTESDGEAGEGDQSSGKWSRVCHRGLPAIPRRTDF